MLRRFVIILSCVWFCPAWIFSGTFVTAKYAGAFLAGGFGARSAAMGNAHAAAVNDASAMFWNPACLVMLDRLEIQGMHSERFSGLVDADYIGAGIPFGDKAALGAGFYRLAVDDIPVTGLLDPSLPMGQFFRDDQNRLVQNVPSVSGTMVNQEMAFFFSYSRRASGFWNWGGGMKLLHKQAGGYSAWGLGFDAGVMLFPYGDCRVAFLLQDATTTVLAWNGKRKECILPACGRVYAIHSASVPSVSFRPRTSNRRWNRRTGKRAGCPSTSMPASRWICSGVFHCARASTGMDGPSGRAWPFPVCASITPLFRTGNSVSASASPHPSCWSGEAGAGVHGTMKRTMTGKGIWLQA